MTAKTDQVIVADFAVVSLVGGNWPNLSVIHGTKRKTNKNKLSKLRRHASRVHFAKIHFG